MKSEAKKVFKKWIIGMTGGGLMSIISGKFIWIYIGVTLVFTPGIITAIIVNDDFKGRYDLIMGAVMAILFSILIAPVIGICDLIVAIASKE